MLLLCEKCHPQGFYKSIRQVALNHVVFTHALLDLMGGLDSSQWECVILTWPKI